MVDKSSNPGYRPVAPQSMLRRGLVLLLVGVSGLTDLTWPLWYGTTQVPAIPWIATFRSIPREVDILLLGFLFCTLMTAIVATGTLRRAGIGLSLCSWGGLLALDQLRLQPWALEFLLILIAMSCVLDTEVVAAWRWIVISIYFWSAISKLDMAFIDGHGQMLLDGLFQGLGISTALWSKPLLRAAAAGLPLFELTTALFLISSTQRRWGWGMSLVMHGGLLVALGPWGLNHEPGVLAWNVWCMIQNLWLWHGEQAAPAPRSVRYRTWVGVVFIYPALEPMGLIDHWPGWAVYCARPEVVKLHVESVAIEQIPASLQPLISPPEPMQDMRAVNLEQWVFNQAHCPIYPQERYRLALARSIVVSANARGSEFRIDIGSSPDRFTGDRQWTTIRSFPELETYRQRFLVNMSPRLHDPL